MVHPVDPLHQVTGELSRPVDAGEVRHRYEARAAEYVARFGSTDQVDADDLARITRLLGPCAGTVVDAGCGPGHLTAHLGAVGVDAIGVDFVDAFLVHARAVHRSGRYVRAAIDRLPLREGAAAGLLAWYSTIHAVPDQIDGMLAEFARVVRVGGPVVVGFFDGGDEVAAFAHQVVTAHRWPVDEIVDRLARAGLAEIERWQRPGTDGGPRPHAAVAATRTA